MNHLPSPNPLELKGKGAEKPLVDSAKAGKEIRVAALKS
jgi:hypothetical protein